MLPSMLRNSVREGPPDEDTSGTWARRPVTTTGICLTFARTNIAEFLIGAFQVLVARHRRFWDSVVELCFPIAQCCRHLRRRIQNIYLQGTSITTSCSALAGVH